MHLEEHLERLARGIAFEAGVKLEVRGLEAFVIVDGAEEHLCTADLPKHLWRSIWAAMRRRFPVFENYNED
jgi:hypothetical protein